MASKISQLQGELDLEFNHNFVSQSDNVLTAGSLLGRQEKSESNRTCLEAC